MPWQGNKLQFTRAKVPLPVPLFLEGSACGLPGLRYQLRPDLRGIKGILTPFDVLYCALLDGELLQNCVPEKIRE